MGALIILVVIVWLVESTNQRHGDMGEAQWAAVGVLIALLVTVCFLGWTERKR